MELSITHPDFKLFKTPEKKGGSMMYTTPIKTPQLSDILEKI